MLDRKTSINDEVISSNYRRSLLVEVKIIIKIHCSLKKVVSSIQTLSRYGKRAVHSAIRRKAIRIILTSGNHTDKLCSRTSKKKKKKIDRLTPTEVTRRIP